MKEYLRLALLIKGKDPNITNKEIRNILKNTYGIKVSYAALRKAMYRHSNKITYTDKKQYTEDDVENYIEAMKLHQKAADKVNTKQVVSHITINDDKPIAIAKTGDWHIGAKGVDYDRLETDMELIENTDGMYWLGGGDYKDNYNSLSPKGGFYEALAQPGMQDKLVIHYMRKYGSKCLGLVRGCHDDWDKKAGDKDFIETLCNVIGEERGETALNLWHGGEVNINIGKEVYKWRIRHKFKYESSLNIENSMRWLGTMYGPCDIASVAHLHTPYFMKRDLGGNETILMRSGSYKVWDEYGQKLANYKGKIGVPVIILFPNTHKTIVMYLKEAVEVLKELRK